MPADPFPVAELKVLLADGHEVIGEPVAQARDYDQAALDAYRRVLGDDHPDTLESASNLAADLRQLGQFQTTSQG